MRTGGIPIAHEKDWSAIWSRTSTSESAADSRETMLAAVAAIPGPVPDSWAQEAPIEEIDNEAIRLDKEAINVADEVPLVFAPPSLLFDTDDGGLDDQEPAPPLRLGDVYEHDNHGAADHVVSDGVVPDLLPSDGGGDGVMADLLPSDTRMADKPDAADDGIVADLLPTDSDAIVIDLTRSDGEAVLLDLTQADQELWSAAE